MPPHLYSVTPIPSKTHTNANSSQRCRPSPYFFGPCYYYYYTSENVWRSRDMKEIGAENIVHHAPLTTISDDEKTRKTGVYVRGEVTLFLEANPTSNIPFLRESGAPV